MRRPHPWMHTAWDSMQHIIKPLQQQLMRQLCSNKLQLRMPRLSCTSRPATACAAFPPFQIPPLAQSLSIIMRQTEQPSPAQQIHSLGHQMLVPGQHSDGSSPLLLYRPLSSIHHLRSPLQSLILPPLPPPPRAPATQLPLHATRQQHHSTRHRPATCPGSTMPCPACLQPSATGATSCRMSQSAGLWQSTAALACWDSRPPGQPSDPPASAIIPLLAPGSSLIGASLTAQRSTTAQEGASPVIEPSVLSMYLLQPIM